MLEGLLHLFARRSLASALTDLFDILVVTYVIYRALLVLRGTRAMQAGTGLGVVLLVFMVARPASLSTSARVEASSSRLCRAFFMKPRPGSMTRACRLTP